MLCKIADLVVQVPEEDGLLERCKEYVYSGEERPDIVIDSAQYRREPYPGGICSNSLAYMESGHQFYMQLVAHGGFSFHASAVMLEGKVYLFSGNCGAGKSTHARIWCQTFPGAVNINDDKPALRCIDGVWYAYGTPWCGKEGIHQNLHGPVAGVCFMEQADHNAISPMAPAQALQAVLQQTVYKFGYPEQLDAMLNLLDHFLNTVPIYRLENLPDAQAAMLSRQAMGG